MIGHQKTNLKKTSITIIFTEYLELLFTTYTVHIHSSTKFIYYEMKEIDVDNIRTNKHIYLCKGILLRLPAKVNILFSKLLN